MKNFNFIDLFAGAGGLSEGFIRAGFNPIAHVESDKAACFTLKTRMARHWLTKNGLYDTYINYLKDNITRTKLYSYIPENIISSTINIEISKINNSKIFKRIDELKKNQKIDLIIGGPPCQAYSLVGRSRDINKMKGDSRNYLFIQYAEYLKRYKPNYFIFENVTGLLSALTEDNQRYLDEMIELFRLSGYETHYKVLDASQFGVLQKRKRIILIGKKGKSSSFYPDFKHDILKNIYVNEIFSDLPELQAGAGDIRMQNLKEYNGAYLYKSGIKNGLDFITFHNARPHTEQDKEIYRIAVEKWINEQKRLKYNDLPEYLKSHKNRDSFTDKFKVVASDLPYSHTVVAHISKDGHYFIHPDITQNRSLTPREAARLQSFPDDYFFEGISEKPGRTAAFRQIGNAVPVLMAEKIANKLKETW